MLPIKRRIKKESFPKIMKEGFFVHTDSLYLRLLDNKQALPTVFSFITPAKIAKTAVKRHFLKRKMSAVVEENLENIKDGFLCLVFIKKDISALPYTEIKKLILELFKKAKILNE